jgi:phage gp36-like protein
MAQNVYATTQDMSVPAKALEGVDPAVVTNALARASSIADGYLRKRFDLPLKDWTQSLTQAVADIATWIVMKNRGFNPDAKSTETVQSSYRDALDWLEDVANNKVDPAFVDSSGAGQDEDNSATSTVSEKPFVAYNTTGGGGWGRGGSGGGGGFWGGP